MENSVTIGVNSKQHDATTNSMAVATSAPQLRTSGRNIDGFFRARTTATLRTATHTPISNSVANPTIKRQPAPSAPEIHGFAAAKSTVKATQPSATRAVNHARPHVPQAAKSRLIQVSHASVQVQKVIVHRQPNHVHHHATQHSQTLRRESVPAPGVSTHNLLKPASALRHKTPSLIETKSFSNTIDTDRLARAQNAPKSPLVARHAAHTTSSLTTFAPLAVQPAPIPTTPPVVPSPTPGNDGVPPAPAPQPDNRPQDIFEHALTNANHFVDMHAHKERYRKKAKTHVASMAFGSLALIVIASFIAYQNSPALQLKVADVKAGISTDMPNFAAAGFTYKGVQAGDSKLTFGFDGNNGRYQLTQSNTNLSDADMIQTIGSTNASGNPTYQVVMAGNTMVYRFDNTNATWVSNGKWYTVSGDNALTNQQVESLVQHV